MHISLTKDAAKFSRHCIKNCTIEEIVSWTINGTDHYTCQQWGITVEEWQNALLVAMREIGGMQ